MQLGFSSTIFNGINRTDARNSVKALTASLAREYDIAAESEPLIFESVDEASSKLQRHLIGAASMMTSEFWLLRRSVAFDRFLIAIHQGYPSESYVVLARDGGGLISLSNLRGKRLTVLANTTMSLATIWLDVELAKKKLPATAALLGSIAESPKPARVVLPVFFGQADACLVTRRAYDAMVELNPQVGRQLRIIAASPDFVPGLFAFRADLLPTVKERCIRAFVELNHSPTGQQTLALFLADAIAERPVSVFASALALLDEYARLCPKASAALVATLHGLRPASPQAP
jgi:phosphonate transport system substrate-binding protein